MPGQTDYYNHNKHLHKKRLLTKRQIDIVLMICQDHSNQKIADLTNTSKRTVEAHKDAIKAKTDTCSNVGIVLYAIKNFIFVP